MLLKVDQASLGSPLLEAVWLVRPWVIENMGEVVVVQEMAPIDIQRGTFP